MHLLSSSVHLPEDTHGISLPMVHSYWLLPNNKEQLCISSCETASRLHPFPAHKWLRRQSLKFKNTSKLYSRNLSWWLASTLTAHLSVQGTCLGLTSKECVLQNIMQHFEQHLNERLVRFLKHMLILLCTTEKNEMSCIVNSLVASVVNYCLIEKRWMKSGGTKSSYLISTFPLADPHSPLALSKFPVSMGTESWGQEPGKTLGARHPIPSYNIHKHLAGPLLLSLWWHEEPESQTLRT